MPWDEDRRRDPSTSRANAKENVKQWHYPSGSANSSTNRIAGGFTDDTKKARAKLRLADWRPNERLERLEQMVTSGEYRPSPGERVELGFYVAARQQMEDDADRYGGDAA